jgi:hypothetical protein
MPFESEKAQKALLGLNDKGRLVIRVDRRIYSVDNKGTPHPDTTVFLCVIGHAAGA